MMRGVPENEYERVAEKILLAEKVISYLSNIEDYTGVLIHSKEGSYLGYTVERAHSSEGIVKIYFLNDPSDPFTEENYEIVERVLEHGPERIELEIDPSIEPSSYSAYTGKLYLMFNVSGNTLKPPSFRQNRYIEDILSGEPDEMDALESLEKELVTLRNRLILL